MTDRDAIALTIYGEARGEGIEGMIAVACVIRNRKIAGRYGKTFADICLHPDQFSCWNEDNPNRDMLLRTEVQANRYPIHDNNPLVQCYAVADVLLTTAMQRALDHATHYHVMGTHASWADPAKRVLTQGHHVFYRDIDGPMPEAVSI